MEKPQLKNNWINGGYFIFNSKFLIFIAGDQTMLEKRTFLEINKKNNSWLLNILVFGSAWIQ